MRHLGQSEPGNQAGSAPRVALIAGGDSEHSQIAKASVQAVRHALRQHDFETTVFSLSRTLDAELVEACPDIVMPCALSKELSHGEVQQLLELRGLPFVGASAETVVTCSDRAATKDEWRRAGLRTPPSLLISRRSIDLVGIATALDAVVAELGGEILVRPLGGLAWDGVRTSSDPKRAGHAIANSFLHTAQTLIVERWIRGPVLSALLVGPTARPEVVAVAQLKGSMDTSPGESVPRWSEVAATIDTREARTTLLSGYRALGCRDLAIMDCVIDDEGLPWLIDVQTAFDFLPTGKAASIASTGSIALEEVIARVVDQRISDWPARLEAA